MQDIPHTFVIGFNPGNVLAVKGRLGLQTLKQGLLAWEFAWHIKWSIKKMIYLTVIYCNNIRMQQNLH